MVKNIRDFSNSKQMKKELSGNITLALKELVENKHLYQSVNISKKPIEDIVKTLIKNDVYDNEKRQINLLENKVFKLIWRIEHIKNKQMYSANDIDKYGYFALPTVKIYCNVCKGKEAYNPESNFYDETFYKEYQNTEDLFENTKDLYQIFTMSWLCQSCKDNYEVIMVKLKKLKLTLCGRNPIEHIEVPKFISEEKSRYYSDAKIAYNSGKILAGIFYLRTFIEQYVNSVIDEEECINYFRNNEDDRTEENNSAKLSHISYKLEFYKIKLPDSFNNMYPSLSSIYTDLSNTIHKADESDEVFIKSINSIDKHFDAIRVSEIKLH